MNFTHTQTKTRMIIIKNFYNEKKNLRQQQSNRLYPLILIHIQRYIKFNIKIIIIIIIELKTKKKVAAYIFVSPFFSDHLIIIIHSQSISNVHGLYHNIMDLLQTREMIRSATTNKPVITGLEKKTSNWFNEK